MAPRRRRVAIGVDFSESSLEAARWAARVMAPDAELVLVHAIQLPEPPSFLRGRYPSREQLIDLARTGAEQRLRELAQSIATGLIWTEVPIGRADEELVRVAAEYEADLIVIGRHGERPGIWERLGGTAERVLSHSSVPVLVVSGTPSARPRAILAAVDGSDVSAAVVDHARSIVRRFDGRATLLYVIPPNVVSPSSVASTGLMPVEFTLGDEQAFRDAASEWLAEQIGRADASDRFEPVVAVGFPSTTILEEAQARDADLIVLGSRGGGTAHRLVLGSVSSAVLHGAHRPVLVVVAAETKERR